MSATDELRRLLDERGVEYRWDNGTVTWYVDGVMYNAWGYDSERLTMSVCHLTPAQAIAATLSCGKLTAEQVRKAIERHFGKVAVLDDGKPVEWRDDWVCKVAIDYKGIADELNATLGGNGKSRWHELFGTPERAARTLANLFANCNNGFCFAPEPESATYDAMLELLRGDA